MKILRAEVLVAQNLPDRAREMLVKARDGHPDQLEFWIALSELADRQGSGQTALSLLDARSNAWAIALTFAWRRKPLGQGRRTGGTQSTW